MTEYGPAPNRLGELTALLVADVPGRRADEAAHRVLVVELAHVEADHGALVVEEVLGERARELRLSDAGGAEEEEAADRAASRRRGPARERRTAFDDGDERLLLTDDALAQLLLHAEELLHLALEHLADGDARPLGDDRGDVLIGDLLLQVRGLLLDLRELAAQLLDAASRARGSCRS